MIIKHDELAKKAKSAELYLGNLCCSVWHGCDWEPRGSNDRGFSVLIAEPFKNLSANYGAIHNHLSRSCLRIDQRGSFCWASAFKMSFVLEAVDANSPCSI